VDITERKILENELAHQAHIDYLTGLSNRRHFMEQGEIELSRAIRYKTPLSVLMLDIDFFKNVNDTYGHQVGDIVLQALSKVCLETLRQVDVAGRLGGEEFAIILPETDSKEALEVAERFREAVANIEVVIPSGLPIHFTVSIGVTTLGKKNINLDILIHQADKALYQAKETGRNKVCVG
jgi:diguanylate cyclase (GGDEF)-like protein